jgi:hypothetical protein
MERKHKKMDDFERIFEAYGADYQVTLGRFMGNRKMYMKFLGMLFQDENLSKLGNALEQGDMTSAFEAAQMVLPHRMERKHSVQPIP